MDSSIVFSPVWASISRDILCPLCDYNLRGLAEPRCPECGYQFDWPTVLDPKLRTHPYLFEVHPERNVRSFLQTLVRNFRFGSLWKTLQPSHRSNTGRLIIYGIVCSVIAMLPAVLLVTWQIYQWGAGTIPTPSIGELLHSASREWLIRGVCAACLIWASFPWLNFLSLRVFGQSMRRARVKSIHVLRCTIYCGDLIVWNALIDLTAVGWYLASGRNVGNAETLMASLFYSGVIVFLFNSARLISAYRSYMRFPHVPATIAASTAHGCLCHSRGCVECNVHVLMRIGLAPCSICVKKRLKCRRILQNVRIPFANTAYGV